jgi:hypothetical protein
VAASCLSLSTRGSLLLHNLAAQLPV